MTTMLRAAIMLAVLVGLPTAWMYYGPLPPRAQRVVDRLVASAKDALDWDQRPRGEVDAAAAIAIAEVEVGASLETPAGGPLPGAETAAPPMRPFGAGDSRGVGAEAEIARRLEPLLMKLRELDAAAYALEPWGGEGRLYRFHCEMPLAGNDQVTQEFEAIGADPQRAVAQVVADVNAWHLSRSVASVR